MIRLLFLTLIFSFLFDSLTAQNISKEDSIKLITTWRKTALFLNSKDTAALRNVCLDFIECKICGYNEDSLSNQLKPIGYFFNKGLDVYQSNKKIEHIISTTEPIIITGGYIDKAKRGREPIYTIAYQYSEQDASVKGHEGTQLVYDFVIRNNAFKLFSISTVP